MKRNGEVGPGCMSDQLIGQWWAHQLGLGYLLPKEKVQAAMQSIFKYNWVPDLTGFKQSPRAFAGEKDKGLLVCTWPKGGRPRVVMLYSDEVWTGMEYQVAAHMIYEGLIEEGLAIVRGARDRYDGVPRPPIGRNPWNEIECGGHYARAMSSWSLLLAASGFRLDGPAGTLEFAPNATPQRFKAFFTGPECWGSLEQVRSGGVQRNAIHVVEGRLPLASVRLSPPAGVRQAVATLAGASVPASLKTVEGGVLATLTPPITIKAGESLVIALSSRSHGQSFACPSCRTANRRSKRRSQTPTNGRGPAKFLDHSRGFAASSFGVQRRACRPVFSRIAPRDQRRRSRSLRHVSGRGWRRRHSQNEKRALPCRGASR